MRLRNVLIAGAGGGIGSALVESLTSRQDVERVYALHRRAVSSVDDKVVWLEADLDDSAAIHKAVDQISESSGIDGLIVATGMLHGPGVAPEKSLGGVKGSTLLTLYAANAVGPLLLLSACRPLFERGGESFACVLSAQVGSIGDNRLGGWYGYRMAKAALNMAVKCAAIELARSPNPVTVVAVHPGTTHTALSDRFVKRRRQAVATPKATAERLIDLLENLTPEASGSFLSHDGTSLPW